MAKEKANDKNQPKLDNYIQGKKHYKKEQSMVFQEIDTPPTLVYTNTPPQFNHGG